MIAKIMRLFYRDGESAAQAAHLESSENTFNIKKGNTVVASIKFSSIQKITAFKRDLGTTDLVCLEVSTSSNPDDPIVEINEEMHGFEDVLNRLGQSPLFLSDWRSKVIHPPFSRQETVIFPVQEDHSRQNHG